MSLILKPISVTNENYNLLESFNEIASEYWCDKTRSRAKLYSLPFLSKYINQNKFNTLKECCSPIGIFPSLAIHLYRSGFKCVAYDDDSRETVVEEVTNKCYLPHLSRLMDMDSIKITTTLERSRFFLDECTIDDFQDATQNEFFFKEFEGLVKIGDRYVYISLLPQHIILNGPIRYFYNLGWKVRISRCDKDDVDLIKLDNESFSSLPLFVIVCTKMENICSSIEFCPCNTVTEQSSSLEELINRVQSIQNLAFIHHQIRSLEVGQSLSDEICMDLFDPNSKMKTIKYRLFILDRGIESTNKFAVFVVPLGREHEWTFNSKDGRIKLANDVQCERLIIIHLGRDHFFENLEVVQKELTSLIRSFKPKNLPPRAKIPFMSLSNKINQRKEIYRGVSDFSGDYTIEEVEDEEEDGKIATLRRLIFLSNIRDVAFIQTKVKLNEEGDVDSEYLPRLFQVMMVDELRQHFSKYPEMNNVLVIGLGGGSLCSYLNVKFPELHIDAVDIDSSVIEIAQRYFGLRTGPNLKVHCADGLNYIRNLTVSDQRYGCIILDVDCKDTNIGLASPALGFVQKSFISSLQTCLKPNGLFLSNFCVSNDDRLREEIIRNFQDTFRRVEVKKSNDTFNEVIVGFKSCNI